MEVILLRDVAKVGRKSTIVTVSEGYALNFLIPKGMARAATANAIRELESSKAMQDASHANEEKKVAEAITNLKDKTVTIHTNLNEQGHVFASIKPEDIATAIYDQCGISLPREALVMTESLREGGTHTIALEGGGAKGEMTLAIVQK